MASTACAATGTAASQSGFSTSVRSAKDEHSTFSSAVLVSMAVIRRHVLLGRSYHGLELDASCAPSLTSASSLAPRLRTESAHHGSAGRVADRRRGVLGARDLCSRSAHAPHTPGCILNKFTERGDALRRQPLPNCQNLINFFPGHPPSQEGADIRHVGHAIDNVSPLLACTDACASQPLRFQKCRCCILKAL